MHVLCQWFAVSTTVPDPLYIKFAKN